MSNPTDSFGPFKGAVADVADDNHTLTTTQIAALKAATTGPAHRHQADHTATTTTPHAGDTLTADHGTWAGDAGPSSYSYQWQSCDTPATCADIPGATGSAYTPTDRRGGQDDQGASSRRPTRPGSGTVGVRARPARSSHALPAEHRRAGDRRRRRGRRDAHRRPSATWAAAPCRSTLRPTGGAAATRPVTAAPTSTAPTGRDLQRDRRRRRPHGCALARHRDQRRRQHHGDESRRPASSVARRRRVNDRTPPAIAGAADARRDADRGSRFCRSGASVDHSTTTGGSAAPPTGTGFADLDGATSADLRGRFQRRRAHAARRRHRRQRAVATVGCVVGPRADARPRGPSASTRAPAVDGTAKDGVDAERRATVTGPGTAPITYTYQWQSRVGLDGTGFGDIDGATATGYGRRSR